MSLDTTVPRSRRALLAAAAGAAAATVVAAVERPLPVAAVDDDVIQQGHTYYGTTVTTLVTQNDVAMEGITSSTEGNPAIWGQGLTSTGVLGLSSSGIGVNGAATDGVGVLGTTDSGTAVDAMANGSGTGVQAYSATGAALAVQGKATFSRSGRVTVPRGKTYADVDLASKGGLSGTPLCFANLMSYRPGVYVSAMRPNYPSTGKLRIYLNKAATASTYVAWVVLG